MILKDKMSAVGYQLVSVCDLAITQIQAGFCTPGVNIGTFCTTPFVGIDRNMHRQHAMGIALTGDMFSAEDAMRFGLVNKVVKKEDLKGEIDKLANKISPQWQGL